ncbi:MAG: glycosyltransferase family 4 protein [Bacteroidota bacterium]
MKHLLYIGNKLSKHGSNSTSIETMGNLFESEGFQVDYASSYRNKSLRMLNMIYSTIRLRNKVEYVLIDVYSTTNFWYAFIISQLCRFFRLKYIPKLHGGNLPNRLDNNPKLCKMVFNNAYINIAPSNYLLTAFQKRGFFNIKYIPNAIEIQNYKFKDRNVIEPKLLWVRSFAPIYNPEMAIKVLATLLEKYPEATLSMVGPDKNGCLVKCKKMAYNLGLKINFPGKLSKNEWTTLSQEYDIFINTTHFDNTPVSVIEAMALGLAVVTTNVGGIPYLLKNNTEAIKVNDNDVEAMVEGIEKLIDEPCFFKEITRNARVKSESFDWNSIKQEWLEILK